jgi:hypothetical protein
MENQIVVMGRMRLAVLIELVWLGYFNVIIQSVFIRRSYAMELIIVVIQLMKDLVKMAVYLEGINVQLIKNAFQ